MHPTTEDEQEEFEKVYCSDLEVGMYVQELDRPWLETPFMFQGFYITCDEDIEALKKFCRYVYINKAHEEIDPRISHASIGQADGSEIEQPESSDTCTIAFNADDSKYTDTTDVEKELETAQAIYAESSSVVGNIFTSAHQHGKVSPKEINDTTANIVGSVLRNPDAFLLLQSLKSRDLHGYTHAINCCALAATFCRHLGFAREEIHEISMGALMLDIGLTRLPDSTLDTTGTDSSLPTDLPPRHVEFGVEILENTPSLPPVVTRMVQTHHERVNGSGYPGGLKGEQIPVCGRIAAIVDCYNALTSARSHTEIITPTDAICAMYNLRNVDFHGGLMEQFIQCIGTYPTGATVELTSGQVGIVIAQNRQRRLYPRVLLILNADGERYSVPHMLDLWEHARKYKGMMLEIRKVVDADKVGIQPSDCSLL